MLKSSPTKKRNLGLCQRLFIACGVIATALVIGGCTNLPSVNAQASSTVAANPAIATTNATTLATPDEAVFVTIELEVDPSKLDEFLAVMAKAAPDTRAFDGCRLFDIYTDDNHPGRVLFYEIWDTKTQQQAYIAWRTETKFRDQIAPYLTGGSPANFYSKFPG